MGRSRDSLEHSLRKQH